MSSYLDNLALRADQSQVRTQIKRRRIQSETEKDVKKRFFFALKKKSFG